MAFRARHTAAFSSSIAKYSGVAFHSTCSPVSALYVNPESSTIALPNWLAGGLAASLGSSATDPLPRSRASSQRSTHSTACSEEMRSHNPSDAMIMKSLFWRASLRSARTISVSVTSGSAVMYGGVLLSGLGAEPQNFACTVLMKSLSHFHLWSPNARVIAMPIKRPDLGSMMSGSSGWASASRLTSFSLKPVWSSDRGMHV